MPKPRYAQISLDATPYYHCICRCVRRAFLCGTDEHSGQSYEHRRGWIEDKLLELADIFAIDIAAYAIMSNHYHVVLHIDKPLTESWDRNQAIQHWHQLFTGNALSQRYLNGESLGQAELKKLDEDVLIWRHRLMDISWFMRVLNESIARQANTEDNCTGRFWEGRFKSQALLDEAALMACMAYVDLNPLRAKMAKTPETSDYTSIKQRIYRIQQPPHSTQQPKSLLPFVGYPRQTMPKGLPFRLNDYLELVDWTGRILREDKRGAIPENTPPILQRLNMDTQHWLYLANNFERPFKGLLGSAYKLKQVCQKLGFQRTPGIRSCETYFP